MCPRTKYLSSYYYMCPHTTMSVSSLCYVSNGQQPLDEDFNGQQPLDEDTDAFESFEQQQALTLLALLLLRLDEVLNTALLRLSRPPLAEALWWQQQALSLLVLLVQKYKY